MSWQFRKDQNPEHWRVEKLILVARPEVEQLERERDEMRKRHRKAVALVRMARNKVKADERQAGVMLFLQTCEQGLSVEQIARACGVSCKHVRECVTEGKRQGWLVESTIPKHGLIRISFE